MPGGAPWVGGLTAQKCDGSTPGATLEGGVPEK
jgi:hypothetical protein